MANRGVMTPQQHDRMRVLSRRACSLGFEEGRVSEAIQSFSEAESLGKLIVSGCNDDDSRGLLVQVLIDKADWFLMLGKYGVATETLTEALDVLEKFDGKNLQYHLFLADAYRALSVADYSSTSVYKFTKWDTKGLFLMRSLKAKYDPLKLENEMHAKLLYLLATYLSYEAFCSTGEDLASRSVEIYTEAIEYLEILCRRYPNEKKFNRRLSVVFRNRAYSYRDVKESDMSQCSEKDAVHAVSLSERLDGSGKVHTAVNLVELYYAYRGLANHLNYNNGNSGKNDRDIADALRKAEVAIGSFVRMVPCCHKHWNSHCDVLLKLATYLEDDEALFVLTRATDSARHSIAQSDKFREGYFDDLIRSLSSRASLSIELNRREEVQALYEAVGEAYETFFDAMKEEGKDIEKEIECCCRILDEGLAWATKEKLVDEAQAIAKLAIRATKRGTSRKVSQMLIEYNMQLGEYYMEKDLLVLSEEKMIEALRCADTMHEEFPWHFFIGRSYGRAHLCLAKLYKKKGDHSLEVFHLREHLRYEGSLHGKGFIPDGAEDASNVSDSIIEELWKAVDAVPELARYSIRCWFPRAGVHSWYSIFIASAVPGRDPLSDQARTLKEDSGGEIPFDVRVSVRKLQGLAIKNNVDFVELFKYAISVDKDENESSSDGEDDSDAACEGSHIATTTSKPVVNIPTTECCICMEPIDCKENRYLKCGHCFHSMCLLDWSEHQGDCPLCRQAVL